MDGEGTRGNLRSAGTVFTGLMLLCVAGGLLWPHLAESHETTSTTVLFDREIVRILNEHCVMCHMDGGISFPLITYEQTWLKGRGIRAEILRRHMPPWSAVPGYGQFANDNSLTLRELTFMVSWVEGLGPRNGGTVFLNVLDPTARPPEPVRAQAHADHWQLGQPPLTLRLPSTTIAANSGDQIQRAVVATGFRTPRNIRAIEYMPEVRGVVRAAFFSVQETGQWIGSWTPWFGYTNLPPSAAFQIPAGAHIVAEIHYRGGKEAVLDRGTLGLFPNDRAQFRTVSNLVLETKAEIPAGAVRQRVRAQLRLAAPVTLLSLRPELSAGAVSIEVSARRPDGSTQVLLFAKDLDAAWPTAYHLKEPLSLPAGTTVSSAVYYNNPAVSGRPGGVRLTLSRY